MMHDSLVDELVVRLVDRLLSKEWPPDVRIPTERRLTNEFGMSRATVRSAIDRLASWNMLVARQGSGTIALPRNRWRVGVFPYLLSSLFRAKNWDELAPLIFDALGVRRALVLDFIERAAAFTKGKDMTAARQACDAAWEGRDDTSVFLPADDRFHMAIMEIGGLTSTMLLVNEIEQTYEDAVKIFASGFTLPSTYHDVHMAIVSALEDGDGVKARELKSAYFAEMDEALLGNLPEELLLALAESTET